MGVLLVPLAECSADQLQKRLTFLYRTWPSDGWDGAAALIAQHARQCEAIESELASRHAAPGGSHGPEHPYYRGECVCRKAKHG
jgi:hypothetical protein